MAKVKLRTTRPKTDKNKESVGAFGDNQLVANHPLAGLDLDSLDLDSIGQNFRKVVPEKVPDEETEVAKVLDKRTDADLRRAALAQIVNHLDISDGLEKQLNDGLAVNIDRLSEFLLSEVVPAVLAVSPALDTVRKVVPKVLGDDDVDIDFESDLLNFAVRMGALRAKAYIVDEMLKVPADWKAAYLLRTKEDK